MRGGCEKMTALVRSRAACAHHPTLRSLKTMTEMTSSFRIGAVAVLLCAIGVGACGKKTPPVTPQPPPAATPAPTTPPTPPPPAPPPATPPSTTPPPREITLDDHTKSLQPVYFDLDSVVIKDDGRAAIQKNAEYLKTNGTVKVLIEGHADSRGTNEYNLALGERRADAVRDYLVGLGVGNDRVTIVSKGEEQPFCKEETEACWAKNRVGYFIATAK
jgi:peptidoglycan-associated lipoprotein